MTYPYELQYVPPLPIIPVQLSLPGDPPRTGLLNAAIDTGADLSIIPVAYLIALEAAPTHQALIKSPFGNPVPVDVYQIDVWIEELAFPGMSVVGNETDEELILGRNLLNKLILLLDGQRGETELFETRPAIRR